MIPAQVRKGRRQNGRRPFICCALPSGSAPNELFRSSRSMPYLPLVSTFCFSSSFIFLTVSSWLDWPVVWVVVAAGLAFGTEVCAGVVFAGRVAVVLGG